MNFIDLDDLAAEARNNRDALQPIFTAVNDLFWRNGIAVDLDFGDMLCFLMGRCGENNKYLILRHSLLDETTMRSLGKFLYNRAEFIFAHVLGYDGVSVDGEIKKLSAKEKIRVGRVLKNNEDCRRYYE